MASLGSKELTLYTVHVPYSTEYGYSLGSYGHYRVFRVNMVLLNKGNAILTYIHTLCLSSILVGRNIPGGLSYRMIGLHG